MFAFAIEFCSRTTIHGVRYFAQQKRHWSERLFWMVAFGASVYFCVLTARSVLLELKENPMQMQLMDTKTAISSIAFPTIVICPDVKTHVDKLNVSYAKQIVTKSPKNFSHEELLQVQTLAHICPNLLPKSVKFPQTFTDGSIYKIMENFSPKIDFSMLTCMWKREPINCEMAFAPILTERGLCFTFNALNSHDIFTNEVAPEMMTISNRPNVSGWSLESGYSPDFNGEAYPLRAFDLQQFGLEFSIRLAHEDMEPICQDLFTGFTIHFHTPGEILTTSQEYVHNIFSRGVNIRIKPTLVTTSPGAQSYEPSIRQCYFSSEIRLRYFKYYTLSNCQVECLANFTNQECGCVKFSMPRDQRTRICDVTKIECYKIAERKLFSDDIIHGLSDDKARKYRMRCNCLPLCRSIKYELEISRFLMKKIYIPGSELGNVTIFFKNHEIETIHRSEKNSVADLLAIGGNLLGLFLGVSAMSLIELAYYFTLRLFWSIRQWKGEIQIVAPIDREDTTKEMSWSIRNLMRDEILDFCSNTGIQGIRYITERGRHWTERFFWVFIVGVAFWLCGKSISNVLVEWEENPIRVDFDDKSVPLYTIPFPTVTLCPNLKVRPDILRMSRVRGILKGTGGNVTNVEWQRIKALTLVCPKLLSDVASTQKFQFKQKFVNETIHSMVQSMSPIIGKHFYGATTFLKLRQAHAKFYTPVWTDEGPCFSFNALNSRDVYTDRMAPYSMIVKNEPNLSNWSLETGYTDALSEKVHPIRAFDSRKNGLYSKMIPSYRTASNLCQNEIIGFKLYLNTPGEVPSSLQTYIQTSFYESVKLYLTPTLVKTTDGLRKYAPSTRKCFFSSERQLRFFKLYTKNNCELECLASFIKQECGCVKLSMPRDNGTLICGAASIQCSQSAEAKLFGFNNINYGDQHARAFRKKCNCLNACTSINYEADVYRVEIPSEFLLWVMFNGGEVKTLLQSESQNVAIFLSICGGLFGLFLGVSALSIIDLLYHFSLHLFWTIQQRRTTKIEPKSIGTTNSNVKSFSRAKTLMTFFIDFCSNTTIDGVRHFTERGRHWSERLFWVIIVAASLYLCGTSIKDELSEWREDPMKISLSDSPIPISTIPFPTITICPEASTTQKMYANVNKWIDVLSKNPENLTKAELSRVNALAFICNSIKEKRTTEKFLDKSLYDGFRDIAPPMMNTINACSWKHSNDSCETIFKPIITSFGLCYAFNAINSHEIYTEEVSQDMIMVNSNPNISGWSLDGGYTDQSDQSAYPIRAFGSVKNSLNIVVDYAPIRDIYCQSKFSSFRVIIGLPGEMVPHLILNSAKVFHLTRAHIVIKPTLVTTAEELRSYDPITRQCFFDSERQLRFFRIYTQQNCEVECLSDFMKRECGCVDFFMPRDNATKICGLSNCYDRVENALFVDDIERMEDENARTFRINCNCLPSCTAIKYEVDIDRPSINDKMQKSWNPKFQLSTANIYFKDYEFMSLKRIESRSFVDFMVTCGGLLGLLLGMSALSVIEIIYYLTLRLFWLLWQKRSSNDDSNDKVAFKPRATVTFIPTNIPIQPYQYNYLR